jgi:hypothetical protein
MLEAGHGREDANRVGYPSASDRANVTSPEPSDSRQPEPLSSHGYHITIGDGDDSFFALCISEGDSDTAWLMSDTVHSLESMR